MLAADVGLESPTYVKATGQNATIEPTLATPSGGGQVGETLGAGARATFEDGRARLAWCKVDLDGARRDG